MSRVQNSQGLYTLFNASTVQSLIIIVPDIGLLEPEKWHRNGEVSWIKRLHQTKVPNSHILLFNHGFNSETFGWKTLVSKADSLIDALLSLREDATITECPIQFIALGVGGIIVKEAIKAAYHYQQRDILFVLSGIVFIGTPHSVSKELGAWRGVSALPRAMFKGFKDKHPLDKEDVLQLSSICEKFDELSLDKPIFSAYESSKTNYKVGFGRNTTMIVGKNFCSVQTNSEELVEVKSDYQSLHCLDSTSFLQMANFIHSAISTAQMRLMVELDRRNAPVPVGRTVRSQSLPHDEDSGGKNKETGRGTAGSTAPSFEIIPGAVPDFTTPNRKLKLPYYMIKNRTPNSKFFDRSEVLKLVEDTLLPSRHSQNSPPTGLKIFSLCGLGGVGKTEIAAKFMLTHKTEFDAVFWIQADDVTKLKESFSQMSIALKLEEKRDAKDQVVSTNLVKHWLDNPVKDLDADTSSNNSCEIEEANWLLIFDNVDSMDDLREFWPEFARRGSVLITSREPLANINIYMESSGINVSPFNDEDGARFLLKLTQSGYNEGSPVPDEVLAIIQRFGGLPLALEQMAGVMQRKTLNFSEFLKKYNSEKHLKDLATDAVRKIVPQSQAYSHNLASVWALDKLKEKASALFECISLLDPDGIKEAIFENGLPDCLGGNFPQSEEEYQEARSELTSRSLVTQNPQLGELRVHRITQDITRSQMSSSRLCDTFDATVKLVSRAWPFAALAQRHHTARWSTCQALIPNVIKLYDLYSSYLLPNGLFNAELNFAKLLTDAAWYLHERGGGDRFFQFLDLAQIICQTDPENSLHIMSDIHYTRGAEAAETNQKPTAFENNTAFLNIRLKISEVSQEGRKDPKLAQAYNQAANAYLDRNEFDDALHYYEQALAVFSSLDNYKETMTTICVANLGTAYWLQGRLEEAERMIFNNLQAREAEYGVNDKESFRTGRLLHVMGNIRVSQGRFVEAFNYHKRALLQYQSTVGNDHHRTADICYKMAEHYMRLGQETSSLTMLTQASRVWESREYYAPEIARLNFLWSKVESVSGNNGEALKRKSIALEKYHSCFPQDLRLDNELSEVDFDNIIGFQSR